MGLATCCLVAIDGGDRLAGAFSQISLPSQIPVGPWSPVGNRWPHLVLAVVLVVVGCLLGLRLRASVSRLARETGLFYPDAWAHGCSLAFVSAALLAALRLVGLPLDLLEQMLLIAFAVAVASIGLAVGLGGRELAGSLLAGYYLRQRFSAGDPVSVAGLEGTIREVGPVSTIVETEENDLLYRRSVPNTLLLKEGIR